MLVASSGCRRPAKTEEQSSLAVTTTYLESAAHDLLGGEVKVLRMAEPGACPGHFDIRPSQAEALRRCEVLLRFDFQDSLDAMLPGEGTNRVCVGEVSVHGGLCIPETYLDACQQVADTFVRHGNLARTNADERLRRLTDRMRSLSAESTNQITAAGLRGIAVITSEHQRDFCEWLGLHVAATFRAADTSSIAEIDRAISEGRLAKASLVVANLPEGRRTADALAERLGAKVVVLENFPLAQSGRASFDEMVANNVTNLVKATGQ